MTLLRRLMDGTWNKEPIVTAARLIIMQGLMASYDTENLGRLANFVNGTSYRADLVAEDGLPIIRISNMTNPETDFVRTREAFDERFIATAGDLLVSWSASFKTIVWPGPDGVVNQHIFKVTPLGQNDRGYLGHMIEASFDDMQRNVVGIGMMHLRRADFLGHLVPAPPPDVQAAVSAYLDWIASGCSGQEPTLPEELTDHRARVTRFRRAVLAADRAHELLMSAREEIAALLPAATEARLDVLRQHYRTAPLAEMVDPSRGISYGVVQTGAPHEAGIPTLRAGDLQPFRVVEENVKRVDPAIESKYQRTRLRGGEVLLRIRGGLGELAVCPESMVGGNVSREIAVIPVVEELIPDYVMYALSAPSIQAFLHANLRGTSYQGINLKDVRRVELPVPPPDAQVAFVRQIDTLRRQLAIAEALQAAAATATDALLPSLLQDTLEPAEVAA